MAETRQAEAERLRLMLQDPEFKKQLVKALVPLTGIDTAAIAEREAAPIRKGTLEEWRENFMPGRTEPVRKFIVCAMCDGEVVGASVYLQGKWYHPEHSPAGDAQTADRLKADADWRAEAARRAAEFEAERQREAEERRLRFEADQIQRMAESFSPPPSEPKRKPKPRKRKLPPLAPRAAKRLISFDEDQ